jgi:hypothetical protein
MLSKLLMNFSPYAIVLYSWANSDRACSRLDAVSARDLFALSRLLIPYTDEVCRIQRRRLSLPEGESHLQ